MQAQYRFKGTLTKISHFVAAFSITNVKIRKSINDCFLIIKIKVTQPNYFLLLLIVTAQFKVEVTPPTPHQSNM